MTMLMTQLSGVGVLEKGKSTTKNVWWNIRQDDRALRSTGEQFDMIVVMLQSYKQYEKQDNQAHQKQFIAGGKLNATHAFHGERLHSCIKKVFFD